MERLRRRVGKACGRLRVGETRGHLAVAQSVQQAAPAAPVLHLHVGFREESGTLTTVSPGPDRTLVPSFPIKIHE